MSANPLAHLLDDCVLCAKHGTWKYLCPPPQKVGPISQHRTHCPKAGYSHKFLSTKAVPKIPLLKWPTRTHNKRWDVMWGHVGLSSTSISLDLRAALASFCFLWAVLPKGCQNYTATVSSSGSLRNWGQKLSSSIRNLLSRSLLCEQKKCFYCSEKATGHLGINYISSCQKDSSDLNVSSLEIRKSADP